MGHGGGSWTQGSSRARYSSSEQVLVAKKSPRECAPPRPPPGDARWGPVRSLQSIAYVAFIKTCHFQMYLTKEPHLPFWKILRFCNFAQMSSLELLNLDFLIISNRTSNTLAPFTHLSVKTLSLCRHSSLNRDSDSHGDNFYSSLLQGLQIKLARVA